MAEIKTFLSPEAEKQVKDYIASISQIGTIYDNISKVANKAATEQAKIVESSQAVEQSINNLIKSNKKLTQQQKNLNADTKEAERLNKQLVTTQAKLDASLTKEAKQLAQKKKELRDVNKDIKNQNVLNDKNAGTIEKLQATNAILRKEVRGLNLETAEGRKELKRLNAQIDANDKKITEFSDSMVKQKRTIGDYGTAFDGVLRPIKAAGGALKAFLANPVIAIISGVVAVFTGLTAAFKRSEKGAQLLASATGVLQGIMSVIVKLSVKVFESLQKAFNDPLGSIQDFGKAIKDNVIARFEAASKLTGLVGEAIRLLFKGEFSQLKEVAKEAGDAIVQIGTGFSTDEIKEGVKGVTENIKETIVETKNAVTAFSRLAVERRNILKLNREIQKSIGEIATAEQLQLSIADDATKSFAEREAAAIKAAELIEKRAAKEKELAQNNLNLIQTEIKLRQQNGENVEALLDQELAAFTELQTAEREYVLAVRDSQKQQSELKQDRLERDLDILIDGFDNQKKVNELLLKDDTKTAAERRKILEETKELADGSFNEQIKTIQEFTDTQINANDLIGESDAKVLNEKIRALGLSEIIEGRLLEIVRERKIVNQELADSEKELNDEITEASLTAAAARGQALSAQRQRDLSQQEQLLRLQKERGVITEKEYQDQVFVLRENALKEEIARLQTLLALVPLTNEQRIQAEKELNDALGQLADERAQKDIDSATEAAEKRKAAQTQYLDASIEAVNMLTAAAFDSERKQTEFELEQLQKRRDAGEISDKAFERRQREIKTKQARADKRRALFEVGINTAAGIVKAIATTGLPAAIPFIVATAALGAIQAGIIASQKIPAFAKGTTYSPDTFIAGEKGRELLIGRSGNLSIANRPTLFTGMTGTKVISNPETEKLIQSAGRDVPFSDAQMLERLDTLISLQEKNIVTQNVRRTRITDRKGLRYKTYLHRMFE